MILVEAVTEGLGEVLVEDTLTGGAGDDQFMFYRPDDQVDLITDFEPNNDQIVVSASNFCGGLVPGAISKEQFVVGTSAEDESDRFIYNDETGNLFFDPDGIGSAAAVQLVTLVQLVPRQDNNISRQGSQNQNNRAVTVNEQPISSLDIIPTRGWVRDENGDVILVSYDPTQTGV